MTGARKGGEGGFARKDLIEWHEGRSTGKQPWLCSGCGVEVVSFKGGGGGKMVAGEDAVGDKFKRQQKSARYADVLEMPGDKTLCQRCRALQKGNVWRAYDALKDVDATVFSSQLKYIVSRRRFRLCVVVVDAADPTFSAVRKLRDSMRGIDRLSRGHAVSA